MKRLLLLAVAILAASPAMMARKDPKSVPAPQPAEEIHWITSIDELQMKMQQAPRKVLIDMYTGWCGWCKKMDASTYTNPAVVKYINNNFYAVKFDAERRDTVRYQGKEYYYFDQYKANGWAIELMKGQMVYPTTILMLENFQQPQTIGNYMDVKQLETALTYFGDNMYRRRTWGEYSASYVSRWEKLSAPAENTPAPGH